MADTAEQQPQALEQTPLQEALNDHTEQTYEQLKRGRFAEEREWYQLALFDQRRQWLTWDKNQKRWSVIRQTPDKPKPMPVTNYFTKAIDAGANQLGKPPRIVAVPHDDSNPNKRAGDYAEKCIPQIDKESGLDVLNVLLRKHVALFGMGITWDYYDLSVSTGVQKVPQVEIQTDPATGLQQPIVNQVQQFTKGKICTDVPLVFEIFLPRDCSNPNLAKMLLRRKRMPMGQARRLWPDAELKADAKGELNEIYAEALRSLVNYSGMQDQGEAVTVSELWSDWDQLDKDLQDKIVAEPGLDIESMAQFGVYIICASGKVLDWGANNLKGKKPATFFMWKIDPANPYSVGLGSDLVPLQKRLNRIDSLIEKSLMTHGAGKWLWPKTQTTKPPSGDPAEVAEYDPIGDGKLKPEFVLPTPFGPAVAATRAAIIADFQELGMINNVADGDAQGQKSFRGLAYLGAKQEQTLNTPRELWERAHVLRYEKCLILAKKYWDSERKVRTAGFNGQFGMTSLFGKDLQGDFDLDFIPDSSRPQTLAEKFQTLQMLLQMMMLDPMDMQTRERIMDLANLEGLNPTDHFQFLKAERDLEKMKQGQIPPINPFIKPEIFLKVFTDFSFTEEFEQIQAQQPEIAGLIFSAIQMIVGVSGIMPQAVGGGQPGMGAPAQPGQDPLSAIPGQTAAPGKVENAAAKQGSNFANKLP